ncbi:hypothetical protein IJJ97_04445 [bacterium]|nr:hypothetical protein [bacterium]
MKNKLLTICSLVCFCLIIFATAFAKETKIVGGMTANIPSKYTLDEKDDESITFVQKEDGSVININYLKVKKGEKLTKEIKEELSKEICKDRDIKITSKSNEKIGDKNVYVICGKMKVEGTTFNSYIYMFQYQNKAIFMVCACQPKDSKVKEKTFRKIIESIY